MAAEDIYIKTDKGKNEIVHKSSGLSMQSRRVLIMVNGESPTAEIEKKALVDDIDSEIQKLVALDLIDLVSGASSADSNL